MRVLTVRQPWAHAIIHQGKTVENSARRTNYRGLLAIHAAKSLDTNVTYHPDAAQPLALADCRFGQVVGTVRVIGCHHASECVTEEGALCSPWAFPDVFHWVLAAPYACSLPTVHRGRLGFWQLDPLTDVLVQEDRAVHVLPPLADAEGALR